jgi:hypothetical protein
MSILDKYNLFNTGDLFGPYLIILCTDYRNKHQRY